MGCTIVDNHAPKDLKLELSNRAFLTTAEESQISVKAGDSATLGRTVGFRSWELQASCLCGLATADAAAGIPSRPYLIFVNLPSPAGCYK